MLQGQLKLPMGKKQEQTCEPWLFHLASVYNFAIGKIELNAKDKIYFSEQEFQNSLANHSEKLVIPSHRLQGVRRVAFEAWQRCFKKLAGKPRHQGMGNKMASIPFPDPIQAAIVFSKENTLGTAKRFAKSVASSAHAQQLRPMLAYKSPLSGTEYVEVASHHSTMGCSDCQALTGPPGLGKLGVRQRRCRQCGTARPRDVNTALHTLPAAAECAVEVAYV